MFRIRKRVDATCMSAPGEPRPVHIAACRRRGPPHGFTMVAGNDFDGLERLLRPLRRELSFELANALVRLKADDEIQGRYDALADKNTAGTLTPAERTELASLVRANSILGVLKIEARAVLTTTGTGG